MDASSEGRRFLGEPHGRDEALYNLVRDVLAQAKHEFERDNAKPDVVVVKVDYPSGKGTFFRVFKATDCTWYSRKHGFLPATQRNLRFYSRFKTEAAAAAAVASLAEATK